jgi:predicted NBD/HSP70 family sugar kinase
MNSTMEMDKVILAVDIGGTKTAAGVITTDGRILYRVTEPTLQNGPVAGIHQIIAVIESLVQQLASLQYLKMIQTLSFGGRI